MAILIRDPGTDRVVRDLAMRTGETLTEAVRRAAELRLAHLGPKRGRIDRTKLAEAQAYLDALPRPNHELTADDLTRYNEEGHFD